MRPLSMVVLGALAALPYGTFAQGASSGASAGAASSVQRPLPTDPGGCLQAANDYRIAQRQPPAGTVPIDANTALNTAREMATTCAKQFNVATIDPGQLEVLTRLYAFIGDSVGLDGAMDRSLTIPGMSPEVRGKAIDGVIGTLLTGSHPTPEGLARAEGLATVLDTLAGAPDATRLAARQSLLVYYDYADVDAPLRRNAEAMLAVARRMRNAAAVGRSYEALARVAGDYLHADSALMVLDQGQRELAALGAAELATRSFEPLRSLYALVGTRGFPIHGAYWLNAPDTMRTLSVGGRVLLIQFTAHWCVPCRNSYPGIRHLAARFAGDAFETVFSTDLYGYFGATSNKLSAEQEVAADVAYYVKDHEIPFKVAINGRRTAPLPTKPGTAAPPRPLESDADRYHVEGIPQMFVLDKRGIIRATVTGWDPGSEARLGALIEQLVHEP